MKIFRFLIGTIVLIFLASCVKDIDRSVTNENGNINTFDFNTSKQVRVDVKYDLQHNTRVELYTTNPLTLDEFKSYVKDETLRPIASGYTNDKGSLSLPVRLAASYERIYAYSPSTGAPVLLSAPITGSKITLSASDVTAPRTTSHSRAIAATEVYWTKWNKQTFSYRPCESWSWDEKGRPGYLLDKPMELDAETLNLIDAAIPKGEKFELGLSQFSHIEISEEANVSVYFISNSSARRNAVGYFTYTGEEIPSKKEINESLTILFPNLSNEALAAGDGVMLKRYDAATQTWTDSFPAGTKIGFVLLTDAWNDNGSVDTKALPLYSHKKYNSYTIPGFSIMADRPHMAAFKANGHFILSFEDLPHDQNPKSPNLGDFSDDVFVMTANPVTALPDVPSVDGNIPPYMTSYEDYGILAFEDNWPYKGDYDLNDVVVKYDSKLHISYDFDYNAIEETYTFLNNGGLYVNGFGIEYGFDLAALDQTKCSIKAFDAAGNPSGIEIPGFDTDQTKATLMLFPNAAKVPVGTQFQVTLVFNQPQSMWGFLLPPYNPFITVNDDGGLRKEVHLVDHTPTSKANPEFFHYGDDLSGNGRYYISDASYPFAIDLSKAETYRIPRETKSISDSYPRFDSWVASVGTKDKDWYLD